MLEAQRLLLVQARSNFAVFQLLRTRPDLPVCHALYCLQMTTELFGKAGSWPFGPNITSHRAFVGFLRRLRTSRQAQHRLGYGGKNEQWAGLIRTSIPLAEDIETLAPALTPDGPNSEYPWPRAAPQTAPAEHRFAVWQILEHSPRGRRFLQLLGDVLATAEAFL